MPEGTLGQECIQLLTGLWKKALRTRRQISVTMVALTPPARSQVDVCAGFLASKGAEEGKEARAIPAAAC